MLYSGSHSGDSIDVDLVHDLQAELHDLVDLARSDDDVRGFAQQMQELITVSLEMGKPIVF